MREHPILFTAPMICAILEGRKSQTRRVIRGQILDDPRPMMITRTKSWDGRQFQNALVSQGYGDVGDRLWVRETLRRDDDDKWYYAADGAPVQLPEGHEDVGRMISWAHHKEGETCVSIHMPRWASRITLEITDLRVERLLQISEVDAKAEGVCGVDWGHGMDYGGNACYVKPYLALWDQINAKRAPWASNPWVWVIQFKKQPA